MLTGLSSHPLREDPQQHLTLLNAKGVMCSDTTRISGGLTRSRGAALSMTEDPHY